MSDALVHRADDDLIAVITLDSAANRNALSRRLIAELTDHLAQAGADESLHGILLRSSHPVFCAGADLKEAATVDMVESARGIIALQRAIVAAPVELMDFVVHAVTEGIDAVAEGMRLKIVPLPFPGFRRRVQVVARSGEFDRIADALAAECAGILRQHFALRFPRIAGEVVYHDATPG